MKPLYMVENANQMADARPWARMQANPIDEQTSVKIEILELSI